MRAAQAIRRSLFGARPWRAFGHSFGVADGLVTTEVTKDAFDCVEAVVAYGDDGRVFLDPELADLPCQDGPWPSAIPLTRYRGATAVEYTEDGHHYQPVLLGPKRGIVVALYEGGASVFDRRTGRGLGSLPMHANAQLRDVAVSPDGRFAIVTQDGHEFFERDTGTVRLMMDDVASRRRLWELTPRHEVSEPIGGGAAFSPDGASYLSALGGALVRIDSRTGRQLESFGELGDLELARLLPSGAVVAVTRGESVLDVRGASHGGARLIAGLDVSSPLMSANDDHTLFVADAHAIYAIPLPTPPTAPLRP